MKEQRLRELFKRYIDRVISSKEEIELMGLWMDSELETTRTQLLENAYDELPEKWAMTGTQSEMIFREIIDGSTPVKVQISKAPVHRIHLLRRARWWAAACIVLLLSAGSYFLFFNKTGEKEIIVEGRTDDVIAPQSNKAMITLANGKVVYLDSATNGKLLQQAGVEVVKLADGKIIYKGSTEEVLYNTLSNPKGSKVIDMTLADGSRVWLNAGSSVTYPVAFIGNDRKVSITGEAYFEVAHNSAMPFIVSKDETSITVLGTHFNVNAYDDEINMRVTLLEGSVKVNSTIIRPGEQAQVSAGVKVIQDVDLEEVMAWKNGRFSFNKTDIQTTMRQIERWYDVEIEYQGNVKGFFIGSIERKENVSQVLKMLGMTGEVNFEVVGKKIIVKP